MLANVQIKGGARLIHPVNGTAHGIVQSRELNTGAE
jgi:hypothetical protein